MASQELIPDNSDSRTADQSGTTDEDPPLASNQWAREQQEEEEEQDEFEQLGLLTQYIGQPPRTRNDRGSTSANWFKKTETQKELLSFKERYLELTDTLDRASNHKEALSKAIARGRTPARLRITIKPMVIEKDDPKFISQWETAIRECEQKLATVIIDHLKTTADKTNVAIRTTSKETFQKLKNIDPAIDAGDTLKTTLAEAQQARNERTENRKRKRAENNGTANKRVPKDT